MNEQPKTFKFNSALLACFDADQTDDVSLESALHSNHVSSPDPIEIEGDDDVQGGFIYPEAAAVVVDETIEATNNAPTVKVQNFIDDFGGLTVNYNSNYIAVASESDGDIWNEEIQDWEYKTGYSISLHNGMMPAFETRNFETIQDLANGMRELAPITNWRGFESEY